MTINERTPLIATIRIERRPENHQHGILRRFVLVAACSTTIAIIIATVIWAIVSLLSRSPPADPHTHTYQSCFNTSNAYASAEALNNNIGDFCGDAANNLRWFSRAWSKTYYSNTPEEHKITVALSEHASGFDLHQCITSLRSIVDYCDVPVGRSSPMNWKQGGQYVQGKYTYQIDVSRQNRPWPPPPKPLQSCAGWYKFIFHHYDIYGAGWANYDWGQESLLPAINPCCGFGTLIKGNAEHNLLPLITGFSETFI